MKLEIDIIYYKTKVSCIYLIVRFYAEQKASTDSCLFQDF